MLIPTTSFPNTLIYSVNSYRVGIRSTSDYSGFGVLLDGRTSENEGYRYGFNGMESDDEVKGDGNSYTTEFRQYDPRIGRWLTLDPLMAEFAGFSPYCFSFNSPLRFNDVKGDRPLPVNSTFNGMGWRIDSGFGRRNVRGDKGASKFHKGVDINTTGGGSTDLGAPVLATHDGIVKIVHDKTSGGGGRYIQIVSPDGSFATQYLHLSEASVVEDQVIKEGDVIGKVGGSGRGSETGVAVHLHYEIMTFDKHGNKVKIDPLFDSDENAGTNNDIGNLIDPQKWVTGELLVGTNTPNPNYSPEKVQELPEVVVSAPKQSKSSTPSSSNRPSKQHPIVKAWNDGMRRIKSFMRHGY